MENEETSHNNFVQGSQEEMPTSSPLDAQIGSCAKLQDTNQTSPTVCSEKTKVNKNYLTGKVEFVGDSKIDMIIAMQEYMKLNVPGFEPSSIDHLFVS